MPQAVVLCVWNSYREVLAIRPFRNLWLGQAVSQFGDALYFLVFLFMVDRVTNGNSRMVGLNGILQTAPYLLFSLYAGVVADRVDRRRVMLFADGASAVLLGLLALYVWWDPLPPVGLLFAAGFLLSFVNVFFAPAKSAAIPAVVPPELLNKANALSAATQNAMPLLGLGLSASALAALYAVAPRWFFLIAVALNGLSFAVSAVFIRRLPPLPPDRKGAAGEAPPNHWQDLKDGLRYLRASRVLWTLLLCGSLVQLMISPFMVVYVAANRQWFGGGFGTLAVMEFSFVVGMVLGSVVVGRVTVRRPGVSFAVGTAIVGACVALYVVYPSVLNIAFWNLIAGLAFPFAQIPMTTYVQATVPDAYRGRVNATLTAANMGIQPLGIGLGGLAVGAIGPTAMFLVMGVGMLLAALGGLRDPEFRAAQLEGSGDSVQ